MQNDEYEKKKLREFHEYVAKNKIEYDRKFYHDQRLVLFMQGNSYKPKETLEAMKVHSDFMSTSLPVEFSRIEKLVVPSESLSGLASCIPADATNVSGQLWCSTPPWSTSKTWRAVF